MFSLLLSTFEMMAITFLIGFVVAGVIKSIAICADSMELHHSSSSEMKVQKLDDSRNFITAPNAVTFARMSNFLIANR